MHEHSRRRCALELAAREAHTARIDAHRQPTIERRDVLLQHPGVDRAAQIGRILWQAE